MHLASEIIFGFTSDFSIFFLVFGPNTYLASKSFYFHVYIMDTASKSLKQARNMVLLNHFMSKGLTKLDIAWPQCSGMSYFMYSMQFLCKRKKKKKQHTDNITYLLNRLMKEIKEIQTIFIDFLPKLNMLVIQSHKHTIEMFSLNKEESYF